MPVSAVDCVQPALQHARAQLFTPFRFAQWSRLALVGILAAELHVGGCNYSGFNFPGLHPHPRRMGQELLPSSALPSGVPFLNPGQISRQMSQHFAQFLGLIVVAALVFMVLGFVFLFLNSVFRFILFDAVLRRECSIGDGWQRWRRAGGRYFLWQLVFQFSVWLFLLILIGVPLALALAAGWAENLKAHIARMIIGVVVFLGLMLVFVLVTVVIQALAKDFLVPIMALDDLDFADGWHRLLAMIGAEKGRFAVYLLLKVVLSIAATILFSIIAIVPGLFLFLPAALAVIAGHEAGLTWSVTTISLAIVSGSVLLVLFIYLIALVCVPGTVFFPAYAMHFLAARYPRLDALLNPAAAPPAPAPELPPIPESPPPAPDSFEAPPLPPSPEPIG